MLVDFWTYTCINWIRTLPYVRAWAEKYQDHGLIVVGVHSPEFGFEKNVPNVRRAAQSLGVHFPIALDSEHAIWNAYDNQYWPAIYLLDAKGRVRHTQFGEGHYDAIEKDIQDLLVEAGHSLPTRSSLSVTPQGAEVAADWETLKSPENYLGFQRTQNFSSSGRTISGKPHDYSAPARLSLNDWALVGNWTMRSDAVEVNRANGRIVYRFQARDVNLVMGSRSGPVKYRVLIDGKPPAEAHGVDVDADGLGTVEEPRMYQLIRQPGPVVQRQVEIEFLAPGAQAFSLHLVERFTMRQFWVALALALIGSSAFGADRPTIVLVHGAFAESASWNGVIKVLEADGYRVVAAANPLRSVKGDGSTWRASWRRSKRPWCWWVTLYGGLVINEAANGQSNVKSLVFVASFAPAVGESALSLSGKFPGSTPGAHAR